MSNESPEFIDGLIVKAPHEKAPDFVKSAISIKRSALISWLSERTEDWINLDVKVSKKGSWYAQVNSWQPSKQDLTAQQNQPAKAPPQEQPEPQNHDFDDDIPF